ncbi:hypothetical protein Goari_001342, partial [Gossypium aridum]|nr:hypothetical protein [Gossypium aridum]
LASVPAWLGLHGLLAVECLLHADQLQHFLAVASLSHVCYWDKQFTEMQNEEGQNRDLYIPRKCSAINQLITSSDHASVQIKMLGA